jgi:hypothetical protein
VGNAPTTTMRALTLAQGRLSQSRKERGKKKKKKKTKENKKKKSLIEIY